MRRYIKALLDGTDPDLAREHARIDNAIATVCGIGLIGVITWLIIPIYF